MGPLQEPLAMKEYRILHVKFAKLIMMLIRDLDMETMIEEIAFGFLKRKSVLLKDSQNRITGALIKYAQVG